MPITTYTVMFVDVHSNMGSAEQEIILDNTPPVDTLDEKVAAAVSDQLEDNKIESRVVAGTDSIKSGQTLDSKSITSEINESAESKPASSANQQFDANGGSRGTVVDARHDGVELHNADQIQNVIGNVPEQADSTSAGSSSSGAAVVSVSAAVELQTNASLSSSGLTSGKAADSSSVGKSNTGTSGGQEYDEVTTAPYQRRSTLARARDGSAGQLQSASESGSAYYTPGVPADQQYSFRYV